MMMKRSSVLFPVILALGGCSLFGGSKQPEPEPQPEPLISQESKDTARQGDQAMLAAQKQMDEQIDKQEADLKKALLVALGKEAAFQGGQPPYPVSASVKELREAKIELSLAPVLDAQGNPVADQFVQLQDSYTTKVTALSRKMAESKASKKEVKFIQNGAKHMVKINDLKAQVRAAVQPAMMSGWMVTTGSMTTMATVSHMIKTRRQMEMKWTEEDYELVRGLMVQQSRREAIAAVTIGLMASYQAVVDGGADGKIVDDVAAGSLEALPLEGTASLEDAKALVDGFDEHIEVARAQYEAQMRKAYGDEAYEAKYKANVETTFNSLASASSAKSATERQADTMKEYEADLAKCARGEKPGSASMVGPGKCKEAKAAADGQGALSADVMARLLGKTGDADPKSLARQGIKKALSIIPGGKQIQRALEGVRALRDGDASKALQLAADLVPLPGPAKMALNSAATIAAELPKLKRKRG